QAGKSRRFFADSATPASSRFAAAATTRLSAVAYRWRNRARPCCERKDNRSPTHCDIGFAKLEPAFCRTVTSREKKNDKINDERDVDADRCPRRRLTFHCRLWHWRTDALAHREHQFLHCLRAMCKRHRTDY